MTNQSQTMTEQEHRAIICVCIMAAFADGAQDEVERAQIERIVKGFSDDQLDFTSAYQDVLSGKVSLPQVAAQLQSPAAKALAYEMAVCVCQADGVMKDAEQKFLVDLRQALQLGGAAPESHLQSAQALAAQPLAGPAPSAQSAARESELDQLTSSTPPS